MTVHVPSAAAEVAPSDVLLRWRRQTDQPERAHHAAQHPQHQPGNPAAAAARHLPPPPCEDFGLSFDGGCSGRIGTPLLGADLRFSGDGGFTGFSSPMKGRQGSLPHGGGGLHSDSALPDDVLLMLTFGRLSPRPGGGADAAASRQAAPAALLSPMWNPAQPAPAGPQTGATQKSPAQPKSEPNPGTPKGRACAWDADCISTCHTSRCSATAIATHL